MTRSVGPKEAALRKARQALPSLHPPDDRVVREGRAAHEVEDRHRDRDEDPLQEAEHDGRSYTTSADVTLRGTRAAA